MNRADKLVFILIIVSAILAYTKIAAKEEHYVASVVNNSEVEYTIVLSEIPDDESVFYSSQGKNGEVVIEFNNQGARVVQEFSQKNYCSIQGWSKDGQPIICLPNDIYIEFNKQDSSNYDGVVQ